MTQLEHKLNTIWSAMKSRVANSTVLGHKHWHPDGVLLHPEWYDNFTSFYSWAIANGYKEGLQLDKDIICMANNITPHIYSPTTCKFVSVATNRRATRLIHSTNTSGYRGVSFVKANKNWKAQIKVDYLTVYLGAYPTAIEASKAYDAYIHIHSLEHTSNGVELFNNI